MTDNQPESTLSGIGVSPGRVLAPLRRMAPEITEPDATPEGDATAERGRLDDAARVVRLDLERRAASADGAAREILETTALMAADPTLQLEAGRLIDTGVGAARAVWDSAGTIAEQFRALGGYMAERAGDVLDVRSRLVAELTGAEMPGLPESDTPYVLLARDLAPADTAGITPDRVAGLLTTEGGPQSHTAIIARGLGLPAIVSLHGSDHLAEGAEVYLDGQEGTLRTPPTAEDRAAAEAWAQRGNPLDGVRPPGVLADGNPVRILANVGSGADAAAAAAAGAEGIGLFRTEFLFLEREEEPSVEEQAAEYAAVLEHFPERSVIVRTLDAGADKPLPFLTDRSEPNPALGVRGYRTALRDSGVLERQLDAIAQAATTTTAELSVMAPMISTAAEARAFTELVHARGLARAGVMVEVPSAAVDAARVLAATDFASIGTNDLTQYTMAADRQLGALAPLLDHWQPAVMQLIARVARAGIDTGGVPVGVCGEAAADPAYAVVLLGFGVTSLSMSPRAMPGVVAVLASVTAEECRALAERALNADDAEAARTEVRAALGVIESLGL